jgi:hypothetical protein
MPEVMILDQIDLLNRLFPNKMIIRAEKKSLNGFSGEMGFPQGPPQPIHHPFLTVE